MLSSILPMLLRYAITILGTYLVTTGWFSEEQFAMVSENVQVIIGAILTIAPVVYAAVKRPSAKALEVAKEVDKKVPAGSDVVIKTPADKPDIVVSGSGR